LPGFLQAQPPPVHKGIVELTLAHRHDQLAETLPKTVLPIPGSSAELLPAATSHAQAVAAKAIWPEMAAVLPLLERDGTDVIVDAGRLGMSGFPDPLLAAADQALLVCRSDLPSLTAAASWAGELKALFTGRGSPDQLAVLLVGPGRPYSSAAVAESLGLPVLGSLTYDAAAAEVLSHGKPARRKSSLFKDFGVLVGAVEDRVGGHRLALGGRL